MIVVEKILFERRTEDELYSRFQEAFNSIFQKIVDDLNTKLDKPITNDGKLENCKAGIRNVLWQKLRNKENNGASKILTSFIEDIENNRVDSNKYPLLDNKTIEEYIKDQIIDRLKLSLSTDKQDKVYNDLFQAFTNKLIETFKSDNSEQISKMNPQPDNAKVVSWALNNQPTIKKCVEWLRSEGLKKYNNPPEFIVQYGDMVYKNDKELYKDCVLKFISDLFGTGSKLENSVKQLSSDFVNNWVESMKSSLHKKDNIFYKFVNNEETVFENKENLETTFMEVYNICTKFENDSNFSNYIDQKDAIVHNPNLYKNVIDTEDKIKLINTDMGYEEGSPKRDVLNRAINSNGWKSFRTDKESENKKKEKSSNRSDYKDITRNVKKEIDKLYPEDAESFVKSLFPSATPNDLSAITKLISKQLTSR